MDQSGPDPADEHRDASVRPSRRRGPARRRVVLWRVGAVVAVAAVAAAVATVLLSGGRASRPATTAVATAPVTPPSGTTTSRPATVARRRPATSFAIGARTLQIDEPSSASIANDSIDGQPIRALPTLLLYPAIGSPGHADRTDAAADLAAGPFPLIVFSQGFDEPVSVYRGLLDAWARAGYAVAAPTYPRTAPAPPGA